MEFDDQHVDTGQLEDRRGMSSGARIGAGAGGLGLIGVIVVVLISMLSGGQVDPGALTGVGPGGGQGGAATSNPTSDVATRCNTAGAIDRYDDCYILKVSNEINEVWTKELPRYGHQYHAPRLVFFERSVSTGCGPASSQTGPFYCPADERIYLDLGFLNQLLSEFGATGRYAQAYVLAHETGHHLQNLLGIEQQVRKAQQRQPGQRNALSVRMELQADCMAGVWGTLADQRGNVRISRTEYQQALTAAAAVGDDRIQSQATGRIDPESFTHGSSAQRQHWFETGYQSADLSRCDTFSGNP